MLSSYISLEQNDNLFSSTLKKHIGINKILKNQGSFPPELSKLLNNDDFTVNQASLLFSDLMHGPFQQFQDQSQKYDFLGKKDLGLLGHTHPLIIKAELNPLFSDLTDLSVVLQDLLGIENLTMIQASESQSESFKFVLADYIDNILTLENSFASGFSAGVVKVVKRADSISNVINQLENVLKSTKLKFSAFALDFQNEKTFDFKELEYYQKIADWCQSHSIPIWINESYGFGRNVSLFKSSLLNSKSPPEILTFGNALIGHYTFSNSKIFKGKDSIKLTPQLISTAMACFTFLNEGNFLTDSGRIASREEVFFKNLTSLKQEFLNTEFDFRISGNLVHIQVYNQDPISTRLLSRILFEEGILVGLQKSDSKWLRLKLPTSLKNEHIQQIFDIMKHCLKRLSQEA